MIDDKVFISVVITQVQAFGDTEQAGRVGIGRG